MLPPRTMPFLVSFGTNTKSKAPWYPKQLSAWINISGVSIGVTFFNLTVVNS